MRKSFSFYELVPFVVALAALPAVVSPAHAQRTRTQQNLERVLILPPMPSDRSADSAYVIELAREARNRLAGRARNQVRVVETERYCEALEASGFNCGTLLDHNAAGQLANFLSADAYVVSSFRRNSTPQLSARIVDIGRSGMAGWVHVEAAPGATPKDLAEVFGDSLREQVRAAEQARQCSERRDRSDFRGARERADRAFEMYPNHPSAAMCLSYVYEVTQAGSDSLIWAYRKAVAGDSLLVVAWERMGRQLLVTGDTAGAINAFIGQWRAEPGNVELLRGIVAQQIALEDFDGAIALIEEALALDPSMDMLRLKAGTCSEAGRWDCALQAFAAQYDMDNALGQDSTFLQAIIGASDFLEDTTASVRWTGVAVGNFPRSVPFLSAHANALIESSDKDSARTVYESIIGVDPSNTRAPLAIAQMMLDEIVVDSTTPLDTMLLTETDSILTSVETRAQGDNATLSNVGALYFSLGLRMGRERVHPRTAAAWLARSLEFPLLPQFVPQANFFLGFSTIFYLQEVFQEVQEAENCEAVDYYESELMRGKNALEAGRSIASSAVDQLLPQYERFETVIPQFRAAYNCTQ